MNPSRNQIHVDPVLSDVSIAYSNNAFVADQVLPVVDTKKKSGIYFEFDKSKFRESDDERAPGSRSNRAGYGLSQTTYGPIVEHSLEDDVPDEIADEYPERHDAYADATEAITEMIQINKERALATIMANTALLTNNTTLAGTDQWSDYANSDPIGDIETGREAVRTAVMRRPNTLMMSEVVYNKLRHHPQLLERFKYSEEGILSQSHLKSLFEVDNIIVAGSMYNSAAEGQTDVLADIWGKHAWLLYIDPTPKRKSVTFGFTFNHNKNGQRRTTKRWYQEAEETTFLRVAERYTHKIVAVGAAYLIKNAVA